MNPAKKLKFLDSSMHNFYRIPAFYNIYPPIVEIAFRKALIEEAERLEPGSSKRIRQLIKDGMISHPHPILWTVYKYRFLIICCIMMPFIWFLSTSAASIGKIIYRAAVQGSVESIAGYQEREDYPDYDKGIVQRGSIHDRGYVEGPEAYTGVGYGIMDDFKESAFFEFDFGESDITSETVFPDYITDPIWLVEKYEETELYSNRLQIITKYEVENIPRNYINFRRDKDALPEYTDTTDRIAGILYHASESDMVPFEPSENQSLKRHTEQLIKYIRYKRLYNYFIDRFGRVYRIVLEGHAAYHAGNSIWSDANVIYLIVNHAFIGICFEGKHFRDVKMRGPGQPNIQLMDELIINDNQFKSGKELTDLLRYKYRISQHNCVPHGLTSINPDKKLIGYHLDLSHGFPFHKFGLGNKYHDILPSITEFGFSYDSYFLKIFNGEVWPGIEISEERVREDARVAGLPISHYRKGLHEQFDIYYRIVKGFLKEEEKKQLSKSD